MADTDGADGAFTFSRSFDAPRTQVWKAFTEVEHLKQWWGPAGFEIAEARLDLRPGGSFVYAMGAAGQLMWGRFVYREIEAPERIVFTNSFSDPEGGLARAPFNPAWPLEVLNVWTFSEKDGKTTIALQGRPLDASEIEQAVFVAGFDSMRMGFGATFDQLEAYLPHMA